MSVNIYLLRHGEITHTGNLAGYTDFGLTELGRQQMRDSTRDLLFDLCISSPLSRCHQMALELATRDQVPLVVEPKLTEMNFGDWDGKSYQQLWQLPKPNIGDFWHKPFAHSPPRGESFSVFYQRVINWWQSFINNENLQDTLVVTHAGVIKCLLAHLLAVEDEQAQITKIVSQTSISYGSVIELSVYKEVHQPAYVQIKL